MGNLITSKAITFFDIETTHLDPSQSAILSITVITDWENGTKDTWTTKIKPMPIELEYASKEALKVCRYSDEEWEDAPSFREVSDTIIEKLKYGPLVAHNIQFDLSHIEAALKRYGYKKRNRTNVKDKEFSLGYPSIDTCALAYLFLPTQRQNLDTLREHFDIDLDRSHDSEYDTEDCRTVFYNILDHISPKDSK
jgi:DNA polymerase III epsilon subunit-like protein